LSKPECIICGLPIEGSDNVCDLCQLPYPGPGNFPVTDVRLLSATCPLCYSGDGSIRIIRTRIHSWGELVQYQCDECGSMFEVLTNTSLQKWTFEEHPIDSTMRASLRSCGDGFAPSHPINQQERRIVADQYERLQCESCPVLFVPRKNAKSEKQTRFCPQCRDDGRADEIMKAETKAKQKDKKSSKKVAVNKAVKGRKK
jgi:DNA-directed RNA polymerase subunit M/transcription elongation factor TFIIS